jgi:hypothetical protein
MVVPAVMYARIPSVLSHLYVRPFRRGATASAYTKSVHQCSADNDYQCYDFTTHAGHRSAEEEVDCALIHSL